MLANLVLLKFLPPSTEQGRTALRPKADPGTRLQDHPKYAEAVQTFGCKSVIHPCWLEECIQMDSLLDPSSKKSYLPLPTRNGLPGMAGKKISLTGYNGLNREELKILVEQAGASYTGSFSRENDVLICYEHSGMKFERAKEWSKEPAQNGRPYVVNHLWLLDCFKEQKWLDPNPYCRLSGQDIGLASLECTPLDLKGKELGIYFEELGPTDTDEDGDIVRSSVPETANEVPESAHPEEEAYSDAPTEVDFHDAAAIAVEEPNIIESDECTKQARSKPKTDRSKNIGEEIQPPPSGDRKPSPLNGREEPNAAGSGEASTPIQSKEDDDLAQKETGAKEDYPTPKADEEIERLFARAKRQKNAMSKPGSTKPTPSSRRPLQPTNPSQSPELSRPEKSRRLEGKEETRSPNPCIALSGMHTDEKNKFTKHVRDLGCKLSMAKHEWRPEITHLVLPRLIRGEKVVAAAAAGKWVLRTSFLEVSCAKKKLVPEVDHEWLGGSGSKLASNVFSFWRLYRSRHGHGPFSGITFALPSRLAGTLTRGMLERIIKAGDGSILQQKSQMDSADVAVLDASMKRSDSFASQCLNAGILCVHGNFVVDWISHPGSPSSQYALFSTRPGHRLLALEKRIQTALTQETL